MNEIDISTENIEVYLIGNDMDIAKGVKLIDSCFKDKITSFITTVASSASEAEVLDMYQEVLSDIAKAVDENKYEPGAESLNEFINRIAFLRISDWLGNKD